MHVNICVVQAFVEREEKRRLRGVLVDSNEVEVVDDYQAVS